MKVLLVILQVIQVWMADPHYERKARNERWAHSWKEASKVIELKDSDEKCWQRVDAITNYFDTYRISYVGIGSDEFTDTMEVVYEVQVPCPERGEGILWQEMKQ
jgi:hypothetical protein